MSPGKSLLAEYLEAITRTFRSPLALSILFLTFGLLLFLFALPAFPFSDIHTLLAWALSMMLFGSGFRALPSGLAKVSTLPIERIARAEIALGVIVALITFFLGKAFIFIPLWISLIVGGVLGQ